MKSTTMGRIAVWGGGITYSAALMIVLVHMAPGWSPDGHWRAACTVLVLATPMTLWKLFYIPTNMFRYRFFRHDDESLIAYGRTAVGTSLAAVAVGLIVLAQLSWNPPPPGSRLPPPVILALTLMPATTLLAGLCVVFAWSLPHRLVRALKTIGKFVDETRRKASAATKATPENLGGWAPNEM